MNMRSDPRTDAGHRRTLDGERIYGAVRTALIGYGVVAFTYFNVSSGSGLTTQGAPGFVLIGLGLQLFLVVARALIKRYTPDGATQGMIILELVADGATVLLFAMATFGGIGQTIRDL
jgi:hypothetical protein